MKRIVAIVLIAVLLLPALPFAGAAFKDEMQIDVKYRSAVNEMTERKIISGFEDGSFAPKKTLTRAQAAKILCVVLEGAEKADALTKTETGFSDVPASHWAAKYVAYCVDKGIVAGVGDGKFNPDGVLSAAAFAKMLLVAYGADASKFVGSDWMASVKSAVGKAFLDNNLKDFTDRALPREEACQMAYNAVCLAEAKETKAKQKTNRPMPEGVPESLKLLAIGNSFSNDATMYYLLEMLQSVGVKNVTIGNLYYSGCTVQRHATFALRDFDGYIYYKPVSGSDYGKHPNYTLKQSVLDEDWDYICFCGGTEPHMTVLTHYVQLLRPEANFIHAFFWADAKTSKRANLNKVHGGDQMKQYQSKVDTVKTVAEPDPRIRFSIPTGTVIQNARTSFLGDNLDRDTYHLNKGIGRYMASMIWCCKLTGVSPESITWYPEDRIMKYIPKGQSADTPGLAEKLRQVAVESVANALANPYEVTQSKITS